MAVLTMLKCLYGCMKGKSIAVTQPRRVAATAIARRVAQEMGVQLGAEVCALEGVGHCCHSYKKPACCQLSKGAFDETRRTHSSLHITAELS